MERRVGQGLREEGAGRGIGLYTERKDRRREEEDKH